MKREYTLRCLRYLCSSLKDTICLHNFTFYAVLKLIPTYFVSVFMFIEILSFKNKNANSAVKNGIAAKHNNVIAAEITDNKEKKLWLKPNKSISNQLWW